MLCERCGVNSADVFLVKIVEGERQVEHVCKECAKEIMPFDEAAKMMKMTFSLEGIMDVQEALKDLLFPVLPEMYGKPSDSFKCPHCGGPLPKSLFDDAVESASKENHEASPHNFALDEITLLKKEMEIAVRDEKYERAAEIRDKIKELENRKEEKGA